MAIVRWHLLSDIDNIRREMDRVFDQMNEVTQPQTPVWKPAIELINNDDHLTLKVALPGIEAKDLDISVTREAVAIQGSRHFTNQASDQGILRSEFRYGQFERAIALPVPVQNDKVEANFTNGILTLTLPKVQAEQKRVVKVNLGAESTSEAATVEAK